MTLAHMVKLGVRRMENGLTLGAHLFIVKWVLGLSEDAGPRLRAHDYSEVTNVGRRVSAVGE